MNLIGKTILMIKLNHFLLLNTNYSQNDSKSLNNHFNFIKYQFFNFKNII